jgi:hypothetical protein
MRTNIFVGGFFLALSMSVFACGAPASESDSGEQEGEKRVATPQPAASPAPLTSAAPAGPRCGDGTCSADESCGTCAQDCGVCKCAEARACTGNLVPPSSLPPTPDFDVKFERKTRDQILAKLRDEVIAGGAGGQVLAAALAQPSAGEPPAVRAMRTLLGEHPRVATALRQHLISAGLVASEAQLAQLPLALSGMQTPMNGPVDCGAPKLSIRVAKVTVFEEDDDIENDVVYCSVSAEGAAGSELKVTPKTPNLDEGESRAFSVGEATIWGQQGPRDPGGDLMLTYDCFEEDSPDGYGLFVAALAREAARDGRSVDDTGWVSDVAGSAARLVPLVMALDTDDHLLEAQQTIPRSAQLKMTDGATWTVRKSGTHLWSDWDWALTMEAWGCAANGGR